MQVEIENCMCNMVFYIRHFVAEKDLLCDYGTCREIFARQMLKHTNTNILTLTLSFKVFLTLLIVINTKHK